MYFFIGVLLYALFKSVLGGFYIVNQDQRAVKTVFGKARRLGNSDNTATTLSVDELERYNFPQLEVIPPGGPYFKFPWEKIYKVSVATETLNMAYDPELKSANRNNTLLEAITKDQLNIELSGQIRVKVSEENIYAYLFGIKDPIAHVMGYFVSVLRERIANFDAGDSEDEGDDSIDNAVSINDLRKNLRQLNEHMDIECATSGDRYGVSLEASLITGIDPPDDVEAALAAVNTAHNQISSDISLARASADQTLVQSKRVVEIETLKAHGETEGLKLLAAELTRLKSNGGVSALNAYVRNIKLQAYQQIKSIYTQKL